MQVRHARPGASLDDALADAVAEAKRGDPLAAIVVVVAHPLAGVAARRSLAARGGIANVATMTLDQLARSIVTGSSGSMAVASVCQEREAVRCALEQWADRFGADDPTHIDAGTLDAVMWVRRALVAGEITVESGSPRAAAMRVLAREVPKRLGERLDPAEVMAVAADRLDGGARPADGVVFFLPTQSLVDDLAAGERRLVDALDRVIGAWAVHASLDEFGDRDIGRVRVLVAPDSAVEVRETVAAILAAVESGVSLSGCAIVAPAVDPWLPLAHAVLDGAAIAHNGRAATPLRSTPWARFALGALRLDRHLDRNEVFEWLARAPVCRRGSPAPVDRWEWLARRAGITRGIRQWHDRLGQLTWELEHARRRPDHDEPEDSSTSFPWPTVIGDIADLADVVEAAAAIADHRVAPWQQHSAATTALLERFSDGAPPSDDLILLQEILRELAALDPPASAGAGGAGVAHEVFTSALEAALDRPATRHGRLGEGVFVGTLDELEGLSFDFVVALGLTDELLPGAVGENALLTDLDPMGAPARHATGSARQRRRFALAMAAPAVVASFPRSDPYGGRECLPSPWLLGLVAAIGDRPLSGEQLRSLAAADAPAQIEVVESFSAHLASERARIDVVDFELAALMRSVAVDPRRWSGGGLADHPLLAGEMRRCRPIRALVARAQPGFTEWDGDVGHGLAPPERLDRREHSPSALERYATCPRRYLYERVLDLEELDDPTDERTVSPRERGHAVHSALETLVRDGPLPRAPDEPWPPEARRRAYDALRARCDELERGGRTGTGLPWRLERHGLQRELARTIDHDDRERRQRNVVPVAVEHRFGFDAAPATIQLDDGRQLAFHGYIDRVDVSPDGGQVIVTDYKTGRAPTRAETTDDRRRGRKLQLPIYALAARDRHPGAAVQARYWYVSTRGGWQEHAVTLDAAVLGDLRRAVGVIVEGIERGRFPARPGERDRDSYVNCRRCPFDRVCAGDREREWERVRTTSSLAAYARLAEGDLGDG